MLLWVSKAETESNLLVCFLLQATKGPVGSQALCVMRLTLSAECPSQLGLGKEVEVVEAVLELRERPSENVVFAVTEVMENCVCFSRKACWAAERNQRCLEKRIIVVY